MKIAFVFPPNWDPHSGASLQSRNRGYTTVVSEVVMSWSIPVYSFPASDCVNGVRFNMLFHGRIAGF